MTQHRLFPLPRLRDVLAAGIVFAAVLSMPSPVAVADEATPAGWLAAPMGWMVDHSPLFSDNVNFKVDRKTAEGFVTEWRYRPENRTLEVRFSPVLQGCPGNSIWSMSTPVELPNGEGSIQALQRDSFSGEPSIERSRRVAERRTVDGGTTISRGPVAWTYRGSAAPEVNPARQADGSWVLRRAYDGSRSDSLELFDECPAPYR